MSGPQQAAGPVFECLVGGPPHSWQAPPADHSLLTQRASESFLAQKHQRHTWRCGLKQAKPAACLSPATWAGTP